MRNFNKVEFSDAISRKFTRLGFSDIHNPSLRFLHRWMSFTLFPMAKLCSVATPQFKCLFSMVNRIKYTHVADIVDYFKNVNKMLVTIECTSVVTRIAINLVCLEIANLAYIEGGIHVLGLDHFIHAHILREKSDHSLYMMYGRKAIWLSNSGLQLYSCESLTLQFDQMGEACHNFTGPPCIMSELVWRQHSRPRLHHRLTLRNSSGTLGMGVATRVTMRVVVPHNGPHIQCKMCQPQAGAKCRGLVCQLRCPVQRSREPYNQCPMMLGPLTWHSCNH
jgi:hypothetical protein